MVQATSFRASWFWGPLPWFFIKSTRGSFKSVEPNRLSSPGVHFKHFGGLGPYITRMRVRRRIFSMLDAGPRYCQNDAQDVLFKHFGVLAPDIAGMGLRMLFVNHFGGRGPNIARMTIPTVRPPETAERRRRDRRAGRARATGTLQQTHGYASHGQGK